MAKQNKINTKHVFTVKGTGQFPFDMLRYDTCWPESQSDTFKLEEMGHRRMNTPARITLVTYREQGPTTERWASFGWEVVVDREVILG